MSCAGALRGIMLPSNRYTDQQYHKSCKAGNLFDILCNMLAITQSYAVQCSAIKYLNIIADNDDALPSMRGTKIVEALVCCIKVVDTRVIEDVLKKIWRDVVLFREISETDNVLNLLIDMFSSHDPAEVPRVTTILESLSSDGTIRRKLQSMPAYQNLKTEALHYLGPYHDHGQLSCNICSPRVAACF
ncbi:hypothetical protein DEU56DRAFT_350440 [Suillus clintonianus]|uniref:uncharacterized protein n=1 Tax=Suillus clintonianus TaxID=1904413 RepID=UPI001B865F7F|nr:uncharacterized protein DEU56DRAFT_350440 [Suillus clintonianus]KAG2137499.1 hypothetical protein DEU56DRAFT_350440 [Suillus clintonianus]